MKKLKSNRGGARPGAGRKTDAKKTITMRVTDAEKKAIEELRKKLLKPE